MKTIICFVLIVTICVGKDGDVYVYNNGDFYKKHGTKPEQCSVFTLTYHSGDMLSMEVNLKNIAPNVSADVCLKYPSDEKNKMQESTKRFYKKGERYFSITHLIQHSRTFEVEVYTTTNPGSALCTKKIIVKGKHVTGIPDAINNTPYSDMCLREDPCVIVVDLSNNRCESSPNHQEPSINAVLIFVIPAVVGTLVIIFVIYLCVKKYSLRNSRPVQTMDATASEVIYADLSLEHGDSQPPRRDGESAYAQIIGVMKPVPR